jgi:bifunctional non-homologous end joining protein LigD
VARSKNPQTKLAPYRGKRDFARTREPAGGKKAGRPDDSRTSKTPGSQRAGSRNLFVIQKHHARRLHWDLRLEVGGVLVSWAVPKEPPKSPGVKRLAVHVEDHPLEYADFEGQIPEGQYGAGKVEIWDRGFYWAEEDVERQIAEGKLEFDLHGGRLQGTYVLVRMEGEGEKQEQWLFFRKESKASPGPDRLPGARRAQHPRTLKPMLCTRKEAPPEGGEWLHEIKWDGYRVLAYVQGGKAVFRSRNGNQLPLGKLVETLEKAQIEDAILDGELVALDHRGISNFKLVHEAVASKETDDLIFYAFDLPFSGGYDLRNCPIEERKALLERLVEKIGSPDLRYSEHSADDAGSLYRQACQTGLEGIISKRSGSPYRSVRSPAWVKVRCEARLDGFVGGFTRLSTGEDLVGALLVGVKDEDGRLVYVGKVGTGFTQALRKRLWDVLGGLQVPKQPFENPGDAPRKGVVWVEPQIACTVQYLDWAKGGIMRQPKLVHVEAEEVSKPKRPPKSPPSPAELPVAISSAGRVVDPSSGLTKGDVAAYYHTVAEWIVPHLEGRPLPVLRCPDGIEGQCFFHKHWIRGVHKSVAKVPVEEEGGEREEYMLIRDEVGLLGLAQMGVVELHPWGSRAKNLEKPDLLIFDLDPGEGLDWKEVADAAHHVREELERLGLATFAKLSGGKGVHVVVPIRPELAWPEAKAFCESFARHMAQAHPKRYTAELPKAKRKGRIFLDYLRNGRGATAAAAYSLRARPGLPVAMPVAWEQVGESLAPNAFGLREGLEHLSSRKNDPWKGFFDAKNSLRQALRLDEALSEKE